MNTCFHEDLTGQGWPASARSARHISPFETHWFYIKLISHDTSYPSHDVVSIIRRSDQTHFWTYGSLQNQ